MNSSDFYNNNKENITYDNKYLYNNDGGTIANTNIPIEMKVYDCKSVDGTYEKDTGNDSNNRKIYLGSNRFSTGDYIKTSDNDNNIMILNCNLDTDKTPSTMCFKYNKNEQKYWLSGKIIEPMTNGKVTDTDTTNYFGNYFLFAKCGTINCGTINNTIDNVSCTFKIKENSKLSKPQISYETTVDDDLQTIVIFTIAVPSINEDS